MSQKQVLSCVERTVAEQAAIKLRNRNIPYELVQIMQATPDGQMKQVYSIFVDEKDYDLALSAIKAKDTYDYKPPKDSFKSYNPPTNAKSSTHYRYSTILKVLCALIILGGLISKFLGSSSHNTRLPSRETPSVNFPTKPKPKYNPNHPDSIRKILEVNSKDIEKRLKEMEKQRRSVFQDLSDHPTYGAAAEISRLMGDTTRVITPRSQEPPTTYDEVKKSTTIDRPKIPESDTVGVGVKPSNRISERIQL